VKILVVSDQVIDRIYALISSGQFSGVDLLLGCGDLPYTYLENILSLLNVPCGYVPGNHDPVYDTRWPQTRAEGAANLDLRIQRIRGLLIGGFGGSVQYRPDGVNQYTQGEAKVRVLPMLPALLRNRILHGRGLDILITHSPPYGIHDEETQAHRGLRAINWLLRIARPRYHFHGHTHFYRQNLAPSVTRLGPTEIVNVYPYKLIEIPNER
jgi:Icc-related predicted phosphoesterase